MWRMGPKKRKTILSRSEFFCGIPYALRVLNGEVVGVVGVDGVGEIILLRLITGLRPLEVNEVGVRGKAQDNAKSLQQLPRRAPML